MTELRSRIAALPPEQRELLESRLADIAARRSTDDRIKPRDRSRPTPLAFAQQREWAIGRLRSANNITGALRLEGELDVDLLGRVLTEIVDRHEALRSTVRLLDRSPVQVVHPVSPVPTPIVDLTHLTPQQQRAEVRRRCAAEVPRPFDPDDPLRMRITLMRLAPDTHVALFTTDHAASDAWSLAILIRELVALYARHHRGGPGLPPPAVQFGDYAAWQQEQFGDERLAAELRYWRETLDGVPPRLPLPTDRPYPARPTFAGELHVSHLSPEFTADLRRFVERENASLFIVLLAATAVLLHRYLEQDDMVIGSAISGRNRVETEQLIGCFSNLLPLRMRIRDEQSLREVVHQARDVMADAYDHQDVSFDRLIEELGLGRESSQTPLVQMMINVLSAPDNALEVPGLRVSEEPMELGQVSIDLALSALPQRDSVQLLWQYMAELFDAETVALLADQFELVLGQVVTASQTQVGQVRLAAATAVPTAAPTPTPVRAGGAGFAELFQRRAALAPHAPAMVHDGVETSYDELNRQANRLAHHLRERGVGPETPVGVLVEPSPLMATAILGVLKAGGAYVPLDPSYPPERLAYMLADAGAQVLVTQRKLADVEIDPPQTVILDGPDLRTTADHDPQPAPDPGSLAYVVYTSGSTGQPKGTMIDHASLVTFAREVADRLGLRASDRFLQFASPSFDVLAEELFPIWLAGGAVVFPPYRLLGRGGDLADLAERDRVTAMELPTAYWQEWVRELDRVGRRLPPALQLVIIGGERVLPERLAMWRRHGVPLLHVYGLTEATVSSTFFRLDPLAQTSDWPNLPIGTPLPSAHLRILDGKLRPVPVGGVGELYVGGIGLARGYLRRPALTAQRFVADPDPARPGQRLYRTGDLVRQRVDGNLEFVSRADTQIKIRGFRVEPTEIESKLCRHDRIAEAVVVAYEPVPGDRRLVAYLVPAPGTEVPDAGELRAFLDRELPAYLVPSFFVALDALPLTVNGKLDRDRLPAPDAGRTGLPDRYVAPRSPLQQRLADIVASVIGIERVGIDDNFFEIGGDSILAIQVVALAQEDGVHLNPLDLFTHPTVALLAEAASAGPAIDAEQGELSGPVPLAPMQRWYCTVAVEDPGHRTLSASLDLAVPVEPGLVQAAVEELLGHHDGLRQRFLVDGARTRVRIAPRGGVTPFEVADLTGVGRAGQADALADLGMRMRAGLDLAVGPLIRVALVRLGEDRPDRIAVVAHRLAVDATSLGILLEDLRTALRHLSAGEPVRLPAKTTSWRSWARRLTTYAGTPQLLSQREYWSALTGEPGARLPVDPTGEPAAGTTATRSLTTRLSAAETEDLLRSAPEALNCDVRELLLAALARTLSGWSGRPRHVVDLERHDREPIFNDVDLSRTVGWFGTLHPIALVCQPDSPPDAVLRTVKEAVRSAPAGGIGWQILRQQDDPPAHPPAELLFSYLGQVAEPLAGDHAEQGDGRSPYAVEVQASVNGPLAVRWRYRERLHHDATIDRLAGHFLGEIRAMLELGRRLATPVHTPSDFPLARVDQAQLDSLFSELAGGQEPR